MRLTTAISQDMRFQFRHGFYYVYAILSVMYIVVLRFLPDEMVHSALTLILFTDICTLGFFFIGAIILLERGQNITESLFVTPLRLSEYLLSKSISFLILSTLSALIVLVGAAIPVQNFLWFIWGLILSSVIYTLFGIVFATKAKHVNDYFVRALGMGLFISLPLLGHLGLFDTPLFYLFPTKSTLILLDVIGNAYSLTAKLYAAISLLLWTLVFAYLAYYRFEKHVRHPA